MPSTSTRLSLLVPDDNTLFITEDIAANWESIDDKVVGFITDVAASRPAASAANAGFLFYATDTSVITFSDGTQWVPTLSLLANSPITYDANTRTIGFDGDVSDLSDVDTAGAVADDLLVFDGSSWGPESQVTVDALTFDTTAGLELETPGSLSWNADEGTIDMTTDGGFNLHIGQEVVYRVKNQTGSPIAKGAVCGFAGTIGTSGVLLAKPFLADGSEPSSYVMGVAAQTIADGEDGYVVHFGKIRKVNTLAFDEGDILYASALSAGGLTAVPPSAPNNIIQIAAVVTDDDENGELFVRPTIGSNIFNDEAVGVSQLDMFDGDVLVWDAIQNVFVNAQQVSALGDLEDVDEGSGAAIGDVLTYDGTVWLPQPTQTALSPVAHSQILIEESYDFPENYNGLSISPTSIADGVQVAVPQGSSWEISPWEGSLSAPLYLTENLVTSSHTASLEDIGKVVAFNSSSNLTLTVPLNSNVGFPIGTVLNVYRHGSGEVNIVGTVLNDGTVDATFAGPTPDANVAAVATQSDGKIVIGGNFNLISGQSYDYLARFQTSGSLDTTFDVNLNNSVYAIAVQPDDKILVGGAFNTVNGVTRRKLIRLNADGTLDTTFANLNISSSDTVYSIALLPDGKILVGGSFTSIGGFTRKKVARLNADGTVDSTFADPDVRQTNIALDSFVLSLAAQSDGKIVIGGQFNAVGITLRNNIARLNSDGTADTTFNPNANGNVHAITLQPDGKILMGGVFTSVSGQTRNRIARVANNGTLDTTFNADVSVGFVYSMILQSDNKILVGGQFSSINSVTRNNLARLNSDGTTDSAFVANANSSISQILSRPENKILVVGNFNTINGVNRNRSALIIAIGEESIVRNAGSIANQYGGVSLRKRAENEWVLAGEVA